MFNKQICLYRTKVMSKSGTFADRSLRGTCLAWLNRRFIIVLQDMAFAVLVKIFLVFNGTQTFIVMYTETVYPTCYGASAILSTNSLHSLFVLNGIMQYTCSGLQGEVFFKNFRTRVTSIKLNPNLFRYLSSRHYGSWLVILTLPPIYPRGRDPVPTMQEAGRISRPVWMVPESLAPSGFDPPKHPARSESLYRLHYADCHCVVLLVTSTSNY
jgi:hypothetical protein